MVLIGPKPGSTGCRVSKIRSQATCWCVTAVPLPRCVNDSDCNGGACWNDTITGMNFCACPEGVTGFHCERENLRRAVLPPSFRNEIVL